MLFRYIPKGFSRVIDPLFGNSSNFDHKDDECDNGKDLGQDSLDSGINFEHVMGDKWDQKQNKHGLQGIEGFLGHVVDHQIKGDTSQDVIDEQYDQSSLLIIARQGRIGEVKPVAN